jgi:hypothetical protein
LSRERSGDLASRRVGGEPDEATVVPAWWLICRSAAGGIEVLTLPCCGGEALVLFGHEEEAELFLWSLGTEGSGGWRIKESRCGEVASVLLGPCANVQRVVLDPPPVMMACWTVALASMDRDDFLAHALALEGAGQGVGRWARRNAAGTRRKLRPASLVRESSSCRRTMRKEHRRRWVARGKRDP